MYTKEITAIIMSPKVNARYSISSPVFNLTSESKPLSMSKADSVVLPIKVSPLKALSHGDAVVLPLAFRSRTYWARDMIDGIKMAKLAGVIPGLTYANFRLHLPLDGGGVI